jgi:hypothetical protein
MSSSDQRVVHLVDDDPAVRRSVGFVLKTSGYQVQSYETGVDLLKAAGDLANGCVLPDIRMPGMDGPGDAAAEGRDAAGGHHDRTWRRCAGGQSDEGRRCRFRRKTVQKGDFALVARGGLQSTFAQGSFGRAETRRRSPIAGPHPTRARPCSTASRMAYRTKRSPTTSASARVRSKFIARIS